VGFQISGYFLYLYFNSKKDYEGLNKLLLAYGATYGIIIFAIFIRTIHTYAKLNSQIKSTLFELSHILIVIGSVVFLYTLTSESFNSVFNINWTRLILFLAIIIGFLILLVSNSQAQVVLIIVAVFIASIFLIIFHWRFLKLLAGNLQKRVLLILAGNVFAAAGVLLEADEFITLFSIEDQILLTIIATPIFICGLFIVFLGLFKFPAFLEFDWKQHLQRIIIVDKANSELIYKFNIFEYFIDKDHYNSFLNKRTNEDLISMGILGIDKVIMAVTKEENLETIKQENYFVLLTYGGFPFSDIVFCVVSNKEIRSAGYFLNRIKDEFLEIYGCLLQDLDSIRDKKFQIFKGFDDNIKKILY